MSISFAFLSEKGRVNNDYLEAALNQGKVYILYPPESNAGNISGCETVPVEKSLPASLNRIIETCGTDFLAVLPENVKVEPGFAVEVENSLADTGVIYGDYFEYLDGNTAAKVTYEGAEDITERADLGPVLIYRTSTLKKAGGWDESLKYVFDYDLRLRLGEKYPDQRIRKQIYTIFPEPVNDEAAKKLFFPGKGKYGGFSYLFMDPAEEKETENVFAAALKRRGAYLEGKAPPMHPEKNTSPLVSVITPVFNREKLIGQAIDSVLAGNFQDFEYIVVDNGSTDNTRSIVARYAEKDRRIRLILNDQNRIAYSLNLGVSKARGKYISQLDSDDIYTPDSIRSMVHFMEKTNCGLGISYYSLIDEKGSDLPEFGIIKHLEYSRNNILRVDGAGAVRMWRRSAIEKLGGFDSGELVDYGEDYDLYLKLGEKFLVGRVHEVLYKYRRHPDNSDILRDPMFKLRNKNLARERALLRRITMNQAQ